MMHIMICPPMLAIPMHINSLVQDSYILTLLSPLILLLLLLLSFSAFSFSCSHNFLFSSYPYCLFLHIF